MKKSTKDELNEINDSAIPIYLTTSAEVKRDQDLNVTNKVCQIFRGDTLQIVGGYDKSLSREKFMQKTDYSHAVIVKAIKNGKTVGEGWCDAGMFNPLQHNWAIVFYPTARCFSITFYFRWRILSCFSVVETHILACCKQNPQERLFLSKR